MTDRELIDRAIEASKNAYVPYSHFPVGAALECDDGSVVSGCNVENAALGCTICAERSAVCQAVSAGRRRFRRIALFAESQSYCTPCGTCRQVLSEFSPSMEVLCAKSDGRYVSYKLSDLLPVSFGKEYLER
ncbi:MAG: cytidine deaminase [Oscillospiraceae bacterium]